ncbi:MAG: hypothetical protein CUN55_08865, partial [Phototrophicales bacterium]
MLKITSFLSLISILIIGILLISACAAFEDPAKRATENAQNTALWTMVYGFQTEMPTMQALALTADSAVFLATQIAQANTQNEFLRATNAALLSGSGGSVNSSFNQPTAIGGGQPAGPVPTTNTSGDAPILLTPNVSTSGSVPTLAGGTRFTQPVTAVAINDDGCASGISNTFTTASSSIYFVTTALDLQAGIRFTLRVTQSGGTIVATDEGFWTSDDFYEQTCIWYN